MEFHLGRTIDHVHLRVSDLEASRRFYRAVLQALGRDLVMDPPQFFTADELFVSADGVPTSGLHLALQADGPEAVTRFHAAALAAGGKDSGAPGERRYHPGYFEAVYHGPANRTASSVVVTPAGGPTTIG